KTIFEEKRKIKKSKSKVSSFESRLFELKEALNDLMTKIEKNYKDYYDLKYNVNTASIMDVQNLLSNDTLFIEYFTGEEFIFIFSITKNNIKVEKVNKS